MNIQKSIQWALIKYNYKTKKDFCEATGISPSLLSRLVKCSDESGTNIDSKLGSLKSVADAFGMKVSEFIALGE